MSEVYIEKAIITFLSKIITAYSKNISKLMKNHTMEAKRIFRKR